MHQRIQRIRQSSQWIFKSMNNWFFWIQSNQTQQIEGIQKWCCCCCCCCCYVIGPKQILIVNVGDEAEGGGRGGGGGHIIPHIMRRDRDTCASRYANELPDMQMSNRSKSKQPRPTPWACRINNGWKNAADDTLIHRPVPDGCWWPIQRLICILICILIWFAAGRPVGQSIPSIGSLDSSCVSSSSSSIRSIDCHPDNQTGGDHPDGGSRKLKHGALIRKANDLKKKNRKNRKKK